MVFVGYLGHGILLLHPIQVPVPFRLQISFWERSLYSCYLFFYLFFHTHSLYFPASSGQALVTGVVPSPPPGSCLQFLLHIRFSDPTVRPFLIECCYLTLSRFPQVNLCTRKSLRKIIRVRGVHPGRFELTKLTYTSTRLEDSLIRHRGDQRYHIFGQRLRLQLYCTWHDMIRTYEMSRPPLPSPSPIPLVQKPLTRCQLHGTNRTPSTPNGRPQPSVRERSAPNTCPFLWPSSPPNTQAGAGMDLCLGLGRTQMAVTQSGRVPACWNDGAPRLPLSHRTA